MDIDYPFHESLDIARKEQIKQPGIKARCNESY